MLHCCSSADHPRSQGAIERFHQTLKTVWRTYCLESNEDEKEDVHLLLFSTREVVQESLGFSPVELVFVHTVHGPLKLLIKSNDKPHKLFDFVIKFCFKLAK
ncbi:uncharacterized protein LOC115568445 [Xyrichtys novacula]|uniref:Uncharacterized protein LOC115568445 n=1 Tax=Xyrichtys novacula TaxID=13765 RepID=A0AAV1GDQ7_XYRNO|nr:uncharacterized protein LOC115568445 [Xyrichtys novacula]